MLRRGLKVNANKSKVMMSWRKEISVSDVSVEEGQKDCICKIINWNTNWIYNNVMTVQYVAGKWRVWRGVHEINDESIFRWFGYIERMETKTSKRIKGIREGLRKRFNLKKMYWFSGCLKKNREWRRMRNETQNFTKLYSWLL